MNTVLQHRRKNVSFQYHSAIFIPSRMYIIQTLLDHCSNFFLSFLLLKISRSGFLSCPGALLQFPIIFQLYIFQFSTNWQCCCSQHAYIFPFFCLGLLLLPECTSTPFSVYRKDGFLQTLFWKLSSSVSFLIRPGLASCNLLHVSSWTHILEFLLSCLLCLLHSQRKNARIPM